MADSTEEEEAAPQGSAGGASWLIVILILVLALAAGAGGTYFFLAPQLAASDGMVEEGESAEEQLSPGEAFKQRLVSLEPFVVNVAGEGYPRFLKVKVELEADSTASKEELEARRPQLRDTTILLLASRKLPDITEFEGQALLKDDLRDRINQIVGRGKVASVMFTELVVQ